MCQRTTVSVTLLVGFFHSYTWAAETPARCSREVIVPPAVNTRLKLGESLIDANKTIHHQSCQTEGRTGNKPV